MQDIRGNHGRWTVARIGTAATVLLLLIVGVLAGVVFLREETDPPRAAPPAAGAPSAPPAASRPPVELPDPPKRFRDRYPVVSRTGATVAGTYMAMHVPRQQSAGRPDRPLPLAVLLPDPGIDASQYGQLGRDLGAQGFVVVVPPRAYPGVVPGIQAWAREAVDDPLSPVTGAVAPERAVVVAHGAAQPSRADLTASSAVVRLLPTKAAGGRAGGGALPALVLTDRSGDLLVVTDEGRREEARRGTILRSDRAVPILEIARLAGAWGRASLGNAASEADLAELTAVPSARFVLDPSGG